MSFKVIGIIPARYASTRFPGKPLISILGKTLLQRTYENAQRSALIEELIVATDDRRIFDHVHQFGGKAVMTSIDCPNGTDRLAEVLNHRPEYTKAKAIINIQGDEPCVDPKAIDATAQLLLDDSEAVMATIASPLETEEDAFSSSVVKCVMDQQGNALYFSRALIPGNKQLSFSPPYYRHIGLYAYRPDFLFTYQRLCATPLQMAEDLEQLKVLEHGYRIKVAVTDHISPGVDIPQDINKIEQWICKQNTSLLQAGSAHL
jgi:3-deoxy-manno-octulosonate cytidylyltransferase (CMP-KDO synthetase)